MDIMTASVHELLQMQTAIANELRSRKAKLQKDIAALSSVQATRAPRSDIGKSRKKPVGLVDLAEMAPAIESELAK